MKHTNIFLVLTTITCLLQPAWAQMASQTVTLSRGWNAIYLRVAPTDTADTVFNDWPVQEVYKVLDTMFLQTSQFSTDINEESVPRPAFSTWSRTGDRRLSFSGVSEGVYLCYSSASANVSFKIIGTPAAPSMAWHKADTFTNSLTKASYNLFGVSMSSGASITYSNYMAGADFVYTDIGKIGGTDLTGPTFIPSSSISVTKVSDGSVLVLNAAKVSSWPGALDVTPKAGLLFGTDDSLLTLGIKNLSAAPTTIQVKYALGNESYPAPLLPLLYWDQASETWANLPATLTLSNVATNTMSVLHVAINRQALNQVTAAGSTQGGVLTVTDTGLSKMMVKLPVSATASSSNDVSHADWPAGLWIGEMTFDHVSFFSSDVADPEDLPAGGTMKIRALMHVDTAGIARLLQRVTLATSSVTTEQENGLEVSSPETTLYAGTQTMPTDATLTRITAAALDIDNPVVTNTASGSFGTGTLAFSYTIKPEGRSNPFYHPFHPDHDGLDAYFEGEAPSGDDLSNYAGSVKPETFSIGNTIEFTWLDSSGITQTVWNPAETTAGTCRWLLKNVRRQGDIIVSGSFQLQRISPVGAIFLPAEIIDSNSVVDESQTGTLEP